MKSVTIIDYGIGNLLSVSRAFLHLNAKVNFVSTPEEILASDRLVLPGVGAFADGMRELDNRHLSEAIKEYVSKQRPLLGICLGMQMMLSNSEEFGHFPGLNIISGSVKPVPETGVDGVPHKIPHIGWNEIRESQAGNTWSDTIFNEIPKESAVFFVHSYMAVTENPKHTLAVCDYNGQTITAAIHRDMVFGCQFHPEKSGEIGLRVIKNFLNQ
jgi:glutamine amidotransferase